MKERRNSVTMRSYSFNGNISESSIRASTFGVFFVLLSVCVLVLAVFVNSFLPEPPGAQDGKLSARQWVFDQKLLFLSTKFDKNILFTPFSVACSIDSIPDERSKTWKNWPRSVQKFLERMKTKYWLWTFYSTISKKSSMLRKRSRTKSNIVYKHLTDVIVRENHVDVTTIYRMLSRCWDRL